MASDRPAVTPLVAAIIPAYGQPGLLGEAILSVLHQSAGAVAVVVDDGCPFAETRDTALSFARARPGQVHYLRRRNGGLSAARNTGIDFALAAWPDLQAVMFLDADNRIRPLFLVRALAALAAAPPEVGWVYPDIDMLGLPESWSMAGGFSLLALLGFNYCDAGSVVHRRVLERGLRFDETLRQGFEDWDFWLQAAETGYQGRHLPMAGFRYRRRGESMATAAAREREVILAAMHRKRRALLRPRSLLALEAQEAPRFAILHPGEDLARITHDPAAEGQTVTLAEFAARLHAARRAPGCLHVPPVLCCAAPGALAVLADVLILAAMFWLVQVLLRDRRAVAMVLLPAGAAEVRISVDATADLSPPQEAVLLAVRTNDLTLPGTDDRERPAMIRIQLPDALLARLPAAPTTARATLAGLKAALAGGAAGPPVTWRRDGRPPRNDLVSLYEQVCGIGIPLPVCRPAGSRGEIGFLIPLHAFGGVEKVVANQARVLRAHGYRPHLFLSGAARFLLTAQTRAAFVSVNPLLHAGFDAEVAGYDYLGVPMSGFERDADPRSLRDVLGLLSGMDVVITTHSLGGHGIAARLRRLGVRMMVSLHLVEHDRAGAPAGNPHMALAYEHAYERVLVISHRLRAWCVAHGVPEDKLLLLPNAPSYPAGDDTPGVPARRAGRVPGPLRLLFLGRLDAQKGLDRLAALIRATEGRYDWRVIGRQVLGEGGGKGGGKGGGGGGAEAVPPGVAVEPPLHDPAELDAAYDWADVLVVPSRFEGVPLTMLEAARRGVVVVATRTGAVEEAVTDGQGGFLVDGRQPEAAIHAGFLDIFGRLAAAPDLLCEQARRAAERPVLSWEQSLAPLLPVLDQVPEQTPEQVRPVPEQA